MMAITLLRLRVVRKDQKQPKKSGRGIEPKLPETSYAAGLAENAFELAQDKSGALSKANVGIFSSDDEPAQHKVHAEAEEDRHQA